MDMLHRATLSARAVFETFMISAPTVVEATLGHPIDRSLHDLRLENWSRNLVDQAKINLRIEGLEHLPDDPEEAFVCMSNHRSVYDIPVIYYALPDRCLRMVTKTELFKIPVFGSALRASGFVEVDRKNSEQAIASLNAARAALNSGVNIWIAPEGTRTRTGALGKFKTGGFHLAMGTGRRILPMALIGTEKIIPVNSLLVRPGVQVTVKIGAPITTSDHANLEHGIPLLAEKVRYHIEELLL